MSNLTDSNLYPHHKPKTKVHQISTSSSLAFTSTLSSLLSNSSSRTTAPARARLSKSNKEDIFATHNRNTKKRAARDLEDDNDASVHFDDRGRRRGRDGKVVGGEDVDDRMLSRSKRKMEAKVRKYNELKRGVGEENELVDFDRKWAEKEGALSSEDEEADDGQHDIVEYEDEYGRMRRGTKTEATRVQRRMQNKLLGAEELDRMSARPAMPERLIYGDTVQTMAFNPDDEVVNKMEELAKKRDRSLTPPDDKHYEASKEFRIKGVGFYGFSQDAELRKKEMENLERERKETERVRREREEKKDARRKEVEERRKAVGAKRARKQADSFLEGLGGEIDGKADRPSDELKS